MRLSPIVVTRRLSFVLAMGICVVSAARRADGQIYIVNGGPSIGNGSISTYSLDGTPIGSPLISGLSNPNTIAVSGDELFIGQGIGPVLAYGTSGALVSANFINEGFVSDLFYSGNYWYTASWANDRVGKYTASGVPVTNALLSPYTFTAVVVSGSTLFAADETGRVGKYTTDGGTLNASLITAPVGTKPTGLAIAGNSLYVGFDNYQQHPNTGYIGVYNLNGNPLNANLITGLSGSEDFAIFENQIYVLNGNNVRLYSASGTLLNPSLISGISVGFDIAVVPEPSTGALVISAILLRSLQRFARRKTPAVVG